MTSGPFTVNIDEIAAGILDMITEHPDGECLTLGMIPAEIMLALEKGLKDRIPDVYYNPAGTTVEECICDDGGEIRKAVSHAVTVAILRMASEEGKCLL